MAELTYRAAVAAGIGREMERDPSVVLLGEDVGAAGGVFKLTEGLFGQFGPERVRDTPISEQAIVGAAMGAAMTGLRPVAELMFSDFFAVTWDMVVNQIAKTRYMTDGQVSLPLVIHTANGAGLRFGAQHSQAIENWAMAIPGLKVVAPSTPADVLGLMVASIRDPDPVIFCASKALLATKGEVPDGEHVVPLGKAAIVREGGDCTIVALASMVPRAVEAAERLSAEHGIEAEVIDLRTLVPLDVAHDPRLGREDEPPVHGRGEPAAVRLGRRDRVPGRRRGVLQPRRAARADHHAARPARGGAGPRGRGTPDGRPNRRHGPSPARGREVTDSDATPIVGVVGTGRMGSAMAKALARAGRPLVLHNRSRDRAEALAAELGARVAATPAEAAAAADVTITMLADDDAVAQVYGADDGLLAGARRGSVLVDLSTVTPEALRAFAPAARAAGVGLLDAPVSGSTALAEAGQLTLMVGGDEADLDRARPALEALAKTIFHLGPLGTGAAMKLATNAVIFGLNEALSEGLVLAELAGIDRAAAYDVLAASAVGAPYVGYKRAAFLDPEGTPVAFSLDLAAKDLRLITAFAESLGLGVPQATVNLAVIRSASEQGRGGNDFSTVAQELRGRARRPAAVGSRRANEEGTPG